MKRIIAALIGGFFMSGAALAVDTSDDMTVPIQGDTAVIGTKYVNSHHLPYHINFNTSGNEVGIAASPFFFRLSDGSGALASFPIDGTGTTGAAVPAKGFYTGTNIGGLLTGDIGCQSTAIYDASTTGSTQMVSLTSTQTIRICGYEIRSGGTAVNVKFVYGTGSNCVTSPQNITPAFQLLANDGQISRSPVWQGLAGAASNAVCINASGAVAVQAILYYTKF